MAATTHAPAPAHVRASWLQAANRLPIEQAVLCVLVTQDWEV